MAKRIIELQADLDERDRRIAELKDELEEERDLTHRLAEQVRDCNDLIDNWIQAFEMVPDESGGWQWSSDFAQGGEWFDKYQSLVRKWNRLVPDYNATIRPRNVGRPLAASEAQCAEVLKLHKAGRSLRGIVDDTSLTLATVRTIVAQRKGIDRTSIKYMQRIDPDRARMKVWLAKKRSRDHLPKQINELRKTGDELLKEAKGFERT
jgi:hypothetical protein